MRNRLNVIWHGKRTTARYSDDLYHLYLQSTGFDHSRFLDDVISEILLHDDDSYYFHHSASEFLNHYLYETISLTLSILIEGDSFFNNSRAQFIGTAPPVSAAQASPSIGH